MGGDTDQLAIVLFVAGLLTLYKPTYWLRHTGILFMAQFFLLCWLVATALFHHPILLLLWFLWKVVVLSYVYYKAKKADAPIETEALEQVFYSERIAPRIDAIVDIVAILIAFRP